jgi:hypothetical protein
MSVSRTKVGEDEPNTHTLSHTICQSFVVTEYEQWDHIIRIAVLVLFQYVMRN